VGVIAVDGGNSKTDLVALSLDGTPRAWLRGPGSNSHGPGGAAGCVAVVDELVARLGGERPFAHGAFFLCGADGDGDIAVLRTEIEARGWARSIIVDNDTFALLHAGSRAADVIAVVCGAGINCVGRAAGGRPAGGRAVQYPALGWETGDWGGAESLGRRTLFHAVRGEDGRGPRTALTELVRRTFAARSAVAAGEAVHHRRIATARLGELAPDVARLAADGDPVALRLMEKLAEEIVLLVARALRDLELDGAEVVLGGGMLAPEGLLYELTVEALPPGARPVVAELPPIAGAGLAALEAAGASAAAAERLRDAFGRGLTPEQAP
jgi:N-acetylglucosamine kinase-like BadF-type ATPase